MLAGVDPGDVLVDDWYIDEGHVFHGWHLLPPRDGLTRILIVAYPDGERRIATTRIHVQLPEGWHHANAD